MALRCALPSAAAQTLAIYRERLQLGGLHRTGGQNLLGPASYAVLKERAVKSFEDAMQRGLTRPATTPDTQAREPARAVVLSPLGNGCLRTSAAHDGDAG